MATQVPQEGSDLSVYQVGKHVKERYHLLETYDMTLEVHGDEAHVGCWARPRTSERSGGCFCQTVNYDMLF